MNEEEKKLYKIGEFASMIGVDISTLRRLEKNGILTPYQKDKRGVRYYTDEQYNEYMKNINDKYKITFTPREFAKQVKRSYGTLLRWDKEGILKSNRTITGRRYYTQDQLKEALKMVNVTNQIDEQTDEKDSATNQPATDVSITSTNTMNDLCKYIYRSPVLFLSPNITERRDFMEKRFGLVSMRFNNRYSDQNTIIEDIKKKDEFKDKKFILLGMDHVKKMSLTDLVEILFICLDCELNDENKNVMKMKKDGDVPAIYLVKEILPEFVDCDQFIICDGCRDITMLWKSFDKRYLKSAFRSIYQLSDTVNVKPEIFDIISDFIIQAIVYCCMMVDDQVDEFRDYYLAQSLSRITRYIKYDILINGLLDSITEMLRAITISEMARFFNPEEDTSDEEK